VSLVYIDACVIIYLIEGTASIQQAVTTKLSQYGASELVTARLSRLECRVVPLRNNDNALLLTYESFFGAIGLTIGELTADVIERATKLRADYGFKTPDALHLASAIEEKAQVFITGDSKLAKCKEIQVEVI
jgi:predicted nucleic acid-binding protein